MFVSGWKWQSGIKNGPLTSPAVLWVVSVRERKPWWKKSSSNCEKISADSSLNSIASIRLCKLNFLIDLRNKNPDRLILSHLNVNSLRNKFEFLVPLVKDNIDILMLSETKLDSSLPHARFSIEGYSKTYRLFMVIYSW